MHNMHWTWLCGVCGVCGVCATEDDEENDQNHVLVCNGWQSSAVQSLGLLFRSGKQSAVGGHGVLLGVGQFGVPEWI